MKKNLAYKILESHLVEGTLAPGEDIAIKIDQLLLQDATGTMAMLEFEALGLDSIKAELAVQYIDHNILQTDSRNADDHRYLQSSCARFGIYFSPAGNGISHQVHMERFGIPGKTLLGADSHTPGATGVSVLGIGAGGLDIALAMAGRPYHLTCPRVMGVKLIGSLPEWVSAKDLVLEMLRRHNVKGGVGKIIEYYGPGVLSLSATDREIIGNMGAELGATSSIFPSDDNVRDYLNAQNRGSDWVPLAADDGAAYDDHDEIDLSGLEPLIACPSSPGKISTVMEVSGIKVDQVIIGSCANSSFRDLMICSKIMEGRRHHPDVAFHINPGSRQVLENLALHEGMVSLLQAGARIHESGCLGCIGMGQAPGTGQVSLRTFPRNFPGRSGTKDDRVYLCSPETASASALKGIITDPRTLGNEMTYPAIKGPEKYIVDDGSIMAPSPGLKNTEIIRGPNIMPLPEMDPLPENLEASVAIKVGDNISTDTIMPAGSRILPLRSNIKDMSRFVFSQISPGFAKECMKLKKSVVIGGENYGQGSSREHAALAPRYLGVRVKIAKSFARIHKANLCNFGIVPLIFENPDHYDIFHKGAVVIFPDIRSHIGKGEKMIPVQVDGGEISAILEVSGLQRQYLLAGGALNFVKDELKGGF
ncbi:MAG: aconitate hydratase [Deltaproteobacteria bacterium]|nr:aconitate hydratase [Deltaproteobacteria bacterium]